MGIVENEEISVLQGVELSVLMNLRLLFMENFNLIEENEDISLCGEDWAW